MRPVLSFALCTLIVMFFANPAAAQQQQPLRIPRTSQSASVTQTIGVTDVTIKYSRPGVKNRTIWGGLVPYNEVWRTGANEATTISFTDTVTINGQTIPAGRYMLATIPTASTWTIILNKNADEWGAFAYDQAGDILRITVTPEQGPHQEWMRFSFEDLSETSAKVVLAWEKLRIPFTIEMPTHELVMRSARSTISWSPSANAAAYLLQRDRELDQAMKWIDLSLSVNENYWNLRTKAQLQAKAGRKKEAVATMQRAIAMGEKMSEPPFDFAEMKGMLAAWKK
jgi:hypothetical protein